MRVFLRTTGTFALVVLMLLSVSSVFAIRDDDPPPPGEETNVAAPDNPADAGFSPGISLVTGTVTYSNPFFTAGVSAPLVILEDQAGFVDRDEGFLLPAESQVMGQITSDFFTSPFTYSLSLPIIPQGTLRDVDNDNEQDTGVMVFAIAYWSNTFGDPFLEERDLYGGGWSTAYASTRVSSNSTTLGEVLGGKYIIYAPDDEQAFPSGFGPDGLLFTDDDPITSVEAGYTLVDLDTEPFSFIRDSIVEVDLIEGEASEPEDYSGMGYVDALENMVDLFRKEYAFTEYKGMDWDEMEERYRPRFEAAEASGDPLEYFLALRDFTWEIPDGHVSMSFGPLIELFTEETDGGLGIAIRDLDDGRVIVNYVLEDSPADRAGIELGAEVTAINGVPIDEAISNAQPWSAPFSTDHVLRLQQLRYAVRFPLDTPVSITYQNPDVDFPSTSTLTTIAERDSFQFSSFNVGLDGFELPLDYQLLPNGYAYVKIFGFLDDSRLSIDLWERMIETLNAQQIPGLIIDMRQNGGGSGFLADQMAAYFFDEPHALGNAGYYDEDVQGFYFNPDTQDHYFLPPEELRYRGEIAVLIGPNCNSACEFFSYDMTIADRAAIVGQYPTAGLGGSVQRFFMPEGVQMQLTSGRAVDADGNIHIEGIGVQPTVLVPVTEETLFYDGDVILDYAIDYLDDVLGVQQ